MHRRSFRNVALPAAIVAALLLLRTLPAGAEHFDVFIGVKTPSGQAEAYMDTTPPIGGLNKRPFVTAKAGDTVIVGWRMKDAYPHGAMKNVTIRFFVVREETAGQKPVPELTGPGLIAENSLTMDFAPGAAATGGMRFKAPEPGCYLVRVQSENTTAEHGHEHFGAVDLVVK